MGFTTGAGHPRWRGGVSVSDKGYLRYRSAPHRNKYVHRVVIEDELKNPIGLCFTPGQSIPTGFTVDHVDHNKQHNCQGNLILMEKKIHDVISRAYQLYIQDHYEEYLEWLHCREDEEVPF